MVIMNQCEMMINDSHVAMQHGPLIIKVEVQCTLLCCWSCPVIFVETLPRVEVQYRDL